MEKDKRIPELPEGLCEWADSKMEQAPIYYQIKGKRAMCRCGKCNAEFEIRWTDYIGDVYETMAQKWDEKPVRFEQAKCKVCDHEGLYEWKRVESKKVEYASFWIMQRTTENDAIVRVVQFKKTVQQGYKQDLYMEEQERYILRTGDPERYKCECRYGSKEWEYYWEKKKNVRVVYQYCDGRYPTWNDELEMSNQKYFRPSELSPLGNNAFGDTQFLIACCFNQGIEMYAKVGMTELVKHLGNHYGKSILVNRKKNRPEEQLRITKERLKSLITGKGNIDLLRIYQLEKKNKCKFTVEQIEFLKEHILFWDKIIRTMKFITLTQLMNRTELYFKEYKKDDRYTDPYKDHALNEYMDYLGMRNSLGYDMENTVFLFPKSLKDAHAKMVKEQNERKDELHIVKKTEEFPMSEKLVKKQNEKYRFEIDGYYIRPAQSVEEIILEGRALHHCVGGDNYLRKHTKGTSTICFLRKQKEKPYITIEVKGSEIVQWYGKNDKKPDKEHIDEILKCWIAAVKKKEEKENRKKRAS